MTDDPMYRHNLEQIGQLLPELRPAARAMNEACFTAGKRFKIVEAFRDQEAQDRKFLEGREPEELVRLHRYGLFDAATLRALLSLAEQQPTLRYREVTTWDLRSAHTDRLAIDCKPLDCSYAELAEAGKAAGIVQTNQDHPWHFEVRQAKAGWRSLLRRFLPASAPRQP